MLPGLERRGLAGQVFGPINLGVLQVLKVDLEDGRLLLEQGVFGVLAPVFVVATIRHWMKGFLPEAVKKPSMSRRMMRWCSS
jgi:hypothetical protein